MPSIPINNLTNKTDINGAELLPFVRDGKTYRCSVSGLFYNNVITTSKINNGAVTPSKLSTGGPSWTEALTGGVFSVPQNGLEFGTGYAQDFECFVDLHTAAIPTDFQTRLSRTGGANGNFRIINNGTGNILLSSSGNVGIGTAAPSAKLEVIGGSVDDSIPELKISGSGGSISTYVSLCAGFYNPIVRDDDKGIIFTGGTVDTGNLVIAPWSNSTSGIRMLSSGNVGIGKHTPTTTLDVDGTVTATGFSGPLNGTATNVSDGVITAAKLDGGQTGSAPIYGVRAWVSFDMTRDSSGAANTSNTNRYIYASGNVSSVLKTDTGEFTITFTTAMPNTNYVYFGAGKSTSSYASVVIGQSQDSPAKTTTGIALECARSADGAEMNFPEVSVSIIG